MTSPRLLALIVACSMFMAQLDSSIVVTALPQMARSFHVHPADLSITLTVYLLVQAVFLPSSSWIADRFGARDVFAAAIVVFTLASMLCGISQTLPEFVAARVLQAIAAALMTPVGRVVLLRSTDRRDMVRVLSISTAAMLIAPTIGPPLGGFITTYLAWPWVFFVNAPIGLVGVALVLRFIPNLLSAERRPFDAMGFVLLAVSLGCLLYGLDRISAASGPGWLASAALVGLGLAVGAWSVRHALTTPHPLVPLWPLKIPSFAITSIGGGALARLPVRAAPFILPLMFQVGMGMTAFRSGLLLLGMSAGDLVLKTLTGRTLRRFGFRTALMVGATIMSLAIAACAGFGVATPVWLIFLVLLGCGMARSITFTGMSTLIYADVPREQVGGATVLWNVTQQVTNALGISLAAILLNLSSAFQGGARGGLSVWDCRFALLVMAGTGLLSVLSFARLPRDAGAELSGHRPRGPE
jgi:EmrB/QacA subfamily drug resistance transporter